MLKVVYISFFRLSIVFILYSLKLNYNVYCFWLDVRILFHRCSLREELANFVSFTFIENYHCLKSVQIRSYFWSVFSCIQSEYRKIRIRNNFVFWTLFTQCIVLNYECKSKNLELLTEVYLGLCQTFMIAFFGQKSYRLLNVNYFRKK